MDPIVAVDARWALLLQCDPRNLHESGMRIIRGSDLDVPIFMRYAVPFFALFPLHTPNSLTVVSTPPVCDEIESWRLAEGDLVASRLEPRLLEIAEAMKLEDAYIFDILTASTDQLTLDLAGDVKTLDRESAPVDWNGVDLTTEVDGSIFGVFDSDGIATWAGEKLVSDIARDIQVATRENARRRGLAKKVASHAISAIVHQGITPYYAHLRGNVASARLASSLGFQPYGSAILAEYQVAS